MTTQTILPRGTRVPFTAAEEAMFTEYVRQGMDFLDMRDFDLVEALEDVGQQHDDGTPVYNWLEEMMILDMAAYVHFSVDELPDDEHPVHHPAMGNIGIRVPFCRRHEAAGV